MNLESIENIEGIEGIESMESGESVTNIGLNITESIRITLGENIKNLTDKLREENINFVIHQQNSGMVRNTIMYIDKHGVELNTINDEIVFIKSSNTILNYIIDITETQDIIYTLNEIREKLSDRFNVTKREIKIDEFNGDTTSAKLSIVSAGKSKVGISIILGAYNKMYMDTLTLIK